MTVEEAKEMTIGVAIAHLEDLQRMYLGNEKYKADVKALDMAIKTLYQEPILDKIREQVELEKLGYPPSADEYKTINKVLQILDKYKAESEGDK